MYIYELVNGIFSNRTKNTLFYVDQKRFLDNKIDKPSDGHVIQDSGESGWALTGTAPSSTVSLSRTDWI